MLKRIRSRRVLAWLIPLCVIVIAGIAWGSMPVNPSRFRGRHAETLVSLAGPLMNLALFALCVLVSVGVILALLAGGVIYFKRMESKFADEV